MTLKPYIHCIETPGYVPDRFDNHIIRRLSDMKGQFADEICYGNMLAGGDPVLYQVYEFGESEEPGDLRSGISILYPGRVGDEYFMTKGHFHTVLETAEVYHCLRGHGMMVMETPEGETSVEELTPGTVLYVPPRWAHRSVNVGSEEELITLFVYPAEAGHDYGTIETRGFRKIVVDRGKGVAVVDNPRWETV